MNPYLLDKEIPSLISFSGGRTSAYMLYKIFDANGGIPDNCYVVFANTGKERLETLDFVHEIENDLNIHIHWLEWVPNKIRWTEVNYAMASSRGEPFQALNRYSGSMPNPVTRKCTADMKITVMHRFMRDQIGRKTEFQSIIGIRYDEPRRWRIEKNDQNKWCENVIPLRYAKVTEPMVMDYWKNMPFDLQLKQGEGNCDLCFLKSAKKLISIIENKPELADWWIKQEHHQYRRKDGNFYPATFRNDRPTYEELKHIAVNQQTFDFGDNDISLPCACHD